MRNRLLKLLSLLIVFSFSFNSLLITAFADEEATLSEIGEQEAVDDNAIIISTSEELLELADSLKISGNSSGIYVKLDADIDLSNVSDFSGIDSFSGTFDGGGHTISGININSGNGAMGFFGYVEKTATIKNLTVDGVIYSTDNNNYVGLIAGVNAGTIENCSAKGIVTGTADTAGIAGYNGQTATITGSKNEAVVYSLAAVGGIAGENTGLIVDCVNAGDINADSSWIELEDTSVKSLSIESIIESFNASVEVGRDIGGIVGYSTGQILDCTNNGIVGYQHAGYNVGGIAGRFCGYISGSTNNGFVYGKQDVGGIVGQFEPAIIEEGESLDAYLNELEDLMNQLQVDTNSAAASGESALKSTADSITSAGQKATDQINSSSSSIQSYISDTSNSVTNRVNSAAESINNLQDKLSEKEDEVTNENSSNTTLQDITDTLTTITDSVDKAQDAIDSIDADKIASESNSDIKSSAADANSKIGETSGKVSQDISDTTGEISSDLYELSDNISSTRNTLNNDINAINDKISDITNYANEQVDNLKRIADGGDVFEDYSAVDSENEAASRMISCANKGYVNGDRNVGGLAGAIAVEGTDSADTNSSSSSDGQSYVTLAVLEQSESNGIIELRKENAGGVVGNSSLGLIRNCLAKNRVISEEGNYIGGIAGYAKGTITNCNSACVLEGSNYVGGVAGAAKKLRNCYSLSDISSDSNWAGEIIGNLIEDSSVDVSVSHSNMTNSVYNNYYVNDKFGGINNASYSGVAEEISYEDLLATDAGEDFANLYAYFYDRDFNFVASSAIQYGKEVSTINFPDLVTEDDTYLIWDGIDSDTVLGNMYLLADEADDVTVIASDLTVNDKVAAYAQGIYYENSKLILSENTTVTKPDSTNDSSNMTVYDVSLKNTAVDDTMESQIRFYIGDNSNVKIYQLSDDKWVSKEVKIAGSYAESSFTGTEATFAVESYNSNGYIKIVVVVIIAAAAAILLIIIIRKRHKKNAK